jgi:phosphoribosylformylglycinamidine synthase
MHAVAEAARNVSCVGAEPLAITDCLNFGNPERPEIYYHLQQAVEGMAAACRALNTPVVSGTVSLYNESGAEAILPTPTVGIVGCLEDVERHAGLSFRGDGAVYLVGSSEATLGGSEYLSRMHDLLAGAPPGIDLDLEQRVQRAVREGIADGLIVAAHDCSEGGLAVTLAESCITAGVGGRFDLQTLIDASGGRLDVALFGEAASRIVVEVQAGDAGELEALLNAAGVPYHRLGTTGGTDFELAGLFNLAVAEIGPAWRSALT